MKPVKDGRSHRKACTECGYKKWEEGDFYVVDTRQLYDQEKLCLDCAEDRFCDLGTDNSDLDCYDGYFSESEGYDAEDIRPHPETGLNADGEIPDRLLSSRGWEYWPVVRSGQYGLVFVVSKAFGYYGDGGGGGHRLSTLISRCSAGAAFSRRTCGSRRSTARTRAWCRRERERPTITSACFLPVIVRTC